jgi:predicted nucleic acid-binding protein
MNVFLDTNVVLDVLAEREPFYNDSAAVCTLAEQGQIRGLVSVLSYANIYYVVRRKRDRRAANRSVRLLRDAFVPVACDEQILGQAIDAGMKEFEDAIQFFSAVHSHADCLVTRDPGHFPRSTLPILSPAEFLQAHFSDRGD